MPVLVSVRHCAWHGWDIAYSANILRHHADSTAPHLPPLCPIHQGISRSSARSRRAQQAAAEAAAAEAEAAQLPAWMRNGFKPCSAVKVPTTITVLRAPGASAASLVQQLSAASSMLEYVGRRQAVSLSQTVLEHARGERHGGALTCVCMCHSTSDGDDHQALSGHSIAAFQRH